MKITIGSRALRTRLKLAETCGALGEPGTVTKGRREGRGVHHVSSTGSSAKQSRPGPGENEL